MLKEVREAGYPIIVVEVYRSPQRQRALYAQGRSDSTLKQKGYSAEEIAQYRQQGYTSTKPVVTRVLSAGMHSQGRAMDCAFVVDKRITYTVPEIWWRIYGATAKKYGLIWGGDWKRIKDRPHIEYRGE